MDEVEEDDSSEEDDATSAILIQKGFFAKRN
jgi:hypothetical protein